MVAAPSSPLAAHRTTLSATGCVWGCDVRVGPVPDQTEVLLIGGRSGVGKSSVALEIAAQLSAAKVQHAYIEGDNLDMAWPPPWSHQLAERNLAAMWTNYRTLGYRRLIYSNVVSVCESATLCAAMADDPRAIGVLLTSSDRVAAARLERREIGSELASHIERSRLRAAELDDRVPAWVQRVPTDGRSVTDIAAQIVAITGWTASAAPGPTAD